jgi:hypothetical protein
MSYPAGRTGIQRNIKGFRQVVSADGGKPIEQMSPRGGARSN